MEPPTWQEKEKSVQARLKEEVPGATYERFVLFLTFCNVELKKRFIVLVDIDF